MMQNLGAFVGRILIGTLFFLSGAAKYFNYEGTQIYMDIMGLPGGMLPLVILLEVGGGLCVIAGIFFRTVSLSLALFCLVTAWIFHTDFSQNIEVTSFLKNLAIAGGLIGFAVSGPGSFRLKVVSKSDSPEAKKAEGH